MPSPRPRPLQADATAPFGAALRAGARAGLPFVVALAPLALLIGVAVAGSGVPLGAGWAASLLLFAGTAHLAAIALLDAGASAAGVVAAVAIVNARLLVLSAVLAPSLRQQPGWFRWLAAHFVVEPTAAIVAERLSPDDDPAWWRGYYLGAVGVLAAGWSAVIGLGGVLGPWVPASLPLAFAGPALMVAMLVPTLTSPPALVAAAVGGCVAVAASGLPNALNLLVGALAGMAAGALAGGRS